MGHGPRHGQREKHRVFAGARRALLAHPPASLFPSSSSLVGTPKSQLRQFEAALLEKEGWSEVQSGLEAKLVAHPDGKGEEQFILCRSSARGQKEAAMLDRQSAALCEELAKLDRALAHRPRRNFVQDDGRFFSESPTCADTPPALIRGQFVP